MENPSFGTDFGRSTRAGNANPPEDERMSPGAVAITRRRQESLPACTLASANTSSGPDTSRSWTPGSARIAIVRVGVSRI